jgi:hypothetical protein
MARLRADDDVGVLVLHVTEEAEGPEGSDASDDRCEWPDLSTSGKSQSLDDRVLRGAVVPGWFSIMCA